MNIAIVINSKIPVTHYGGTQRVVWSLAKELNSLGHNVTFLAKEGSVCDFANVIFLNPQKSINEQIPKNTDVVHFNDKIPFNKIDEPVLFPYIITYNGNFMNHELDYNAVFVSKNHAQRYGSNSYVHNGLDWSEYGKVELENKRAYYHFLGKAAWSVKNVRGAINVIKALKHEDLYVLGGYRINFKMGFRFTLTTKAHFKGMVGGDEKLRYLQSSKGLIFPVIWDEPFGLAITESLYFGAPVFGTPYGSLPEIVAPEVGFLTNNQNEMIQHLSENHVYNPKTCHEYANELFNSRLMAERYLLKYEAVMNGNKLNAVRPKSINPDKKMEWII